MDRRDYEHWSFDKRIPIALILTMFFQFGVGVWWVSALNSRVGELEKGADKNIAWNQHEGIELVQVKERILKLEMSLTNINQKLDEIRELVKRK